jgi:hypothetical protein
LKKTKIINTSNRILSFWLIKSYDFNGYRPPYSNDVGVFASKEEAVAYVNYHTSPGLTYVISEVPLLEYSRKTIKKLSKEKKI